MVYIGKTKLNKSVIASIGENPILLSEKAKQLGADILELRIDLINSDFKDMLIKIKKLGIPIIITNRMKSEGGKWEKSEKERINLILSLLPYSDAIDIELSAENRDIVIKKAKEYNKTVIVSKHYFKTPPDKETMKNIIYECFELNADISKLAINPNSIRDVFNLLEITINSQKPVCTIAMGKIGKHSRIVFPIYGSVMTYGYVDKPTAPGQFRIDELKNILNSIS